MIITSAWEASGEAHHCSSCSVLRMHVEMSVSVSRHLSMSKILVYICSSYRVSQKNFF